MLCQMPQMSKPRPVTRTAKPCSFNRGSKICSVANYVDTPVLQFVYNLRSKQSKDRFIKAHKMQNKMSYAYFDVFSYVPPQSRQAFQ